MEYILCIETSGQFCSVAIKKEGIVYSEQSLEPMNHVEAIAELIQVLFNDSNILFKELKAVAISDGPGSYTGLRIGASTAKGLCVALDIPLISLSTLESLATEAKKLYEADIYWPMIDARRMEVYEAKFDQNLKQLTEINNLIISDLGIYFEGGKKIVVCGDGAFKMQQFKPFKILEMHQNAIYLIPLAEEKYIKKSYPQLENYEPNYFKSANITIA